MAKMVKVVNLVKVVKMVKVVNLVKLVKMVKVVKLVKIGEDSGSLDITPLGTFKILHNGQILL